MKIIEYIDGINKKKIKEIYGRRFSHDQDHVVIWEDDKDWTEINRLMLEGKL